MHAKLQCWMGQWPYKLNLGYTRHVAHWHEEDMEYGGMSMGVKNPNEKHWWFLLLESMHKQEKEEKSIMPKAS